MAASLLSLEGDLSLDEALALGDLRLRFADGRQLCILKGVLEVASPVLRDMVTALSEPRAEEPGGSTRGKRKRTEEGEACQQEADSPSLQVGDDDHGAWVEVAKHLYRGMLCSAGPRLDLASAFKMLPVVHKYSMGQLLGRCLKVVQDLDIPIRQAPASDGQEQQPGLLQWLRLADDLQFEALTRTCLVKLRQQRALPAVRAALASPEQRSILQGLRPSTLMDVMACMSGFAAEVAIQPQGMWGRPKHRHDIARDSVYPQEVDLEYTLAVCDGTTIIHPAPNDTLKVWDMEGGRCLGELEGHADVVRSAAASPCGQSIMSGSGDCDVRVWDLASLGCRATLKGHRASVFATCWCGPGVGASGDIDGVVKLWDLATGTQAGSDLRGSPAPEADSEALICSLASTGYGQLLVAGIQRTELQLWDLRTRSCVRTMEDGGAGLGLAVDGCGRTLVSGSGHRELRFWDLGSGRLRASVELNVTHLVMDDAATVAISVNSDSDNGEGCGGDGDDMYQLTVWDVASATCTKGHNFPDRQQLLALCAAPDLASVALLSRDRNCDMLELWQ